MRFVNYLRDHAENSPVVFVKQMRNGPRVAVDSQYQLGQVIGTNRVSVEDLQKLVSSNDIRRELTHCVNFESLLTLLQSVLGHYLNYAFGFRHSATKRNHDLDVGQTHLFAHT